MPATILVTGASGNAGTEVVSALRASYPSVAVRTTTRHPERAALPASVHLDFQDPSTFRDAVSGCTSVFLLRPPSISNTRDTLNRFITVARNEGVARIVFLSVAGADDLPFIPHHAVEQHLRSGPPDWTILRPGFFAQNLASAYHEDIMQDDRLYLPAGRGRVAFVDLRDVGAVAAQALVHRSAHAACAYTLTGPEAYTFYDVARILSAHVGRPVDYVPASIPGYLYHATTQRGFMQAVVQTVLHVGLRFGQAEAVDPTLERLLDRRPHTVADYIRDHAHTWRHSAG